MNIGKYKPIGVMVKNYDSSLFGHSNNSGTPILTHVRLQIWIHVLQNLWCSLDYVKFFFLSENIPRLPSHSHISSICADVVTSRKGGDKAKHIAKRGPASENDIFQYTDLE